MSVIKRNTTRAVKVGSVIIGGGFPISVQTMWKMPLTDAGLDDTARGLDRLSAIGCDLVRFAVPDMDAAERLGKLAAMASMPLVADIHFDHHLALRCLDFPIKKIRINPGTMGDEEKVREVVMKAADRGVPLRVGINAGSLPRSLEGEKNVPAAMVKAAEMELEILERLNFKDVVVSLKSSDIRTTVSANVLFSRTHDNPLHIGITEAGPLIPGLVKNTIGVHSLLQQGMGDTIRVSLTSDPESEVLSGNEILKCAGRRSAGVDLISCPKCGRTTFDVKAFLEDVSDFIYSIKKPLTIAVMGCPVNGPGEAKRADIGITGAGKYAVIFEGGKVLRRVPYSQAADAFREEVMKLCEK